MAVEKLESIEVETYFGKCKCCFNYGYLRTMWEKHIVDGEAEIYGALLTQCFGIQWTVQRTEEDDQICEECICKLRDANTFKKQVVACQQLLASKSDDGVIVETLDIDEVKQESDEYYIEYLDEDILEKDKINGETSDEDNNNDCHLTEDETINDNLKVLKYDSESQNTQDDGDSDFMPDDEDVLDEEAPDSPAPRKRSLQKPQQTDESDTENDGTPKPKWPKKLPTIERYKTYKQYTDDDLKRAVQSVLTRVMNQKQAAKNYHVPRKTLAAKIRAVKATADNEADLRYGFENVFPKTPYLQLIDDLKTVLKYTNATPFRSRSNNIYCFYCPGIILFNSPSELCTHTLAEHTNTSTLHRVMRPAANYEIVKLDTENMACKVCKVAVKNWTQMLDHLNKVHGVTLEQQSYIVPYKLCDDNSCAICDKRYSAFVLLDAHMNTHYGNYICTTCGDSFITASRYKSHEKIHETGRIPCPHCEKVFTLERYMRKHVVFAHTKEQKVKCKYCDQKFVTDGSRYAHMIQSHRDHLETLTCEICGAVYNWMRLYMQHMKRIHNKTYKCDQCNKCFFKESMLLEHKFKHTGVKMFECSDCAKQYYSTSGLERHMRTAHKGAT